MSTIEVDDGAAGAARIWFLTIEHTTI